MIDKLNQETLTPPASSNAGTDKQALEAKRKLLREQIELREMAKSLYLDKSDWHLAFDD